MHAPALAMGRALRDAEGVVHGQEERVRNEPASDAGGVLLGRTGEEPTTAFGKACARLDIAIIAANSPQAKGRVERAPARGGQQDRLVKELRLRGVTTIDGANEVMCGGFVDQLNEKFAKPPTGKEDAHPPKAGSGEPRRGVLRRGPAVGSERLGGALPPARGGLQISRDPSEKDVLPRPKEKVTVRRLLDGTVQVVHAGGPPRRTVSGDRS